MSKFFGEAQMAMTQSTIDYMRKRAVQYENDTKNYLNQAFEFLTAVEQHIQGLSHAQELDKLGGPAEYELDKQLAITRGRLEALEDRIEALEK